MMFNDSNINKMRIHLIYNISAVNFNNSKLKNLVKADKTFI